LGADAVLIEAQHLQAREARHSQRELCHAIIADAVSLQQQRLQVDSAGATVLLWCGRMAASNTLGSARPTAVGLRAQHSRWPRPLSLNNS
jgi:hypothetical protein